MEVIKRVRKYFDEEMVETPDGTKPTGNYFLVIGARLDDQHIIHHDYAPDKFTLDDAVPLSNNFEKHGDIPGRQRFYKKDPEPSST